MCHSGGAVERFLLEVPFNLALDVQFSPMWGHEQLAKYSGDVLAEGNTAGFNIYARDKGLLSLGSR